MIVEAEKYEKSPNARAAVKHCISIRCSAIIH